MRARVLFVTVVLLGLPLHTGFSQNADFTVSPEDEDIQSAIDAAAGQGGGTVEFLRGNYNGDFDLSPNVVLRGKEAAETVLNGTIGGQGGTLERFTITVPIALDGNSAGDSLVIRSSIFVRISGTALQLENFTDFEVSNNTFYDNGTGVQVETSTGEIRANIFAQNETGIAAPNAGVSKNDNLFSVNMSDGDTGNGAITDDPLLVDPEPTDPTRNADFHLLAGSPCIDEAAAGPGEEADPDGTAVDCGAYGGPNADTTPLRVSGLTVTPGEDNSAKLEWDQNRAYNVDGYEVHYGLESGNLDGSEADQGGPAIPVEDPAIRTFDITGLPTTAVPPPAPTNIDASPGNESIVVTWDEVPEADGYRVLWGTTSGQYGDPEDVGDVTRYTVTGLANGVTYFAAVQAYATTKYFFAVTASTDVADRQPLQDEELEQGIGKTGEEQSAEVSEIPEPVRGFPDLPERGLCFLSSAAMGPGNTPWRAQFWVPALLVAALAGLVPGGRATRLLVVLVLVLSWSVNARAEAPRWSLSTHFGAWLPTEDDWDDHFGSDVTLDFKAGLGYLLTPWLELGLEAGLRKEEGTIDRTLSGRPLVEELDQILWIIPVQPYVLVNVQWTEDQLLVPYVAGGLNRYYYVQDVDGASNTDGYLNGYHLRAGLKVLLNRFDPQSSGTVGRAFGLDRTYFALEVQYAAVDDFGDEPTDLGGWTFFGGAALQF
jgi:hypothetical protein